MSLNRSTYQLLRVLFWLKHRLQGIAVRASRKVFRTIDEYIVTFPRNVQVILKELRRTIRDSAPEAEEAITYGMPAFKLNGNLVFFAAFKNHIGFYPTPSAIEAFKEELSDYEVSKGTIRFPMNRPVPLDLVRRIVAYRVKENQDRKKR
ncbi:MAG: hypothetical protein C4K47_01980 [Candidatus Thorarchaeota archaeon]|nr:MAG: hypothetical protein C4K47_01980 [Candidatus Thorarchaeota archaeon]